jgi:hypothetical protein
MPILVSFLGGRKALKQGHYDFGIFGVICNVVSICKWSLRPPFLTESAVAYSARVKTFPTVPRRG